MFYIFLLMYWIIVKLDWFGFINLRKDLFSLLIISYMYGGGFYVGGGYEYLGGINVIFSRIVLINYIGCKLVM